MKEDLLYQAKKTKPKVSLLRPVLVFVGLSGVLSGVTYLYDFSSTNLGALAFILAATLALLISKYVYDELLLDNKLAQAVALQVEEETRPARLLFAEVYQNSPIAYLVADTVGTITSANPAALRLFGLTPNAILGTPIMSLITDKKTEHTEILSEKIFNGVGIANEEIMLERKEEVVWVELSVFHYVGNDGELQHLVTLIDVTRQKQVEQAKTEFVSLASHQLRTPITGMRWSADLLLMDEVENLSDKQRKYLARLVDSIGRMNTLIDDFLQVSRFELGTRTAHNQEVDLKELFTEVINESQIAADNRNLVINENYDSSVSTINTDLGLLRMIVTNLYTNAIKYSSPGGEVDISYKSEDDNLIVRIRDTGMGIPVLEQPRIFTKIFRASNAVREVPDGTGLGLYIAKRAVQVLRGRISFVSAENQGSTFEAVIPRN